VRRRPVARALAPGQGVLVLIYYVYTVVKQRLLDPRWGTLVAVGRGSTMR